MTNVLSVVQAPVVISRDHHDVSGTDSPFRETSNVYDGSAFCAGVCCWKPTAQLHRAKTLTCISTSQFYALFCGQWNMI